MNTQTEHLRGASHRAAPHGYVHTRILLSPHIHSVTHTRPVFRRHAPGTDARPARTRALYYRAWPVCMVPRGACRCHAGSGRRRAFIARVQASVSVGKGSFRGYLGNLTRCVSTPYRSRSNPRRDPTMYATDRRFLAARHIPAHAPRRRAPATPRDAFTERVWRVVLTFPSPAPSPIPSFDSSPCCAPLRASLLAAPFLRRRRPHHRALAVRGSTGEPQARPSHARSSPRRHPSAPRSGPLRGTSLLIFPWDEIFLKISSNQHRYSGIRSFGGGSYWFIVLMSQQQ